MPLVRLAAWGLPDSPVAGVGGRRSSLWERWVVAAVDHALARWGGDPTTLSLVLATASGDGDAVDTMLRTVTGTAAHLSPSVFLRTVSVIAAGAVSRRLGSRRPATVVTAGAYTFGSGLLEAMIQCAAEQDTVLFVWADASLPSSLGQIASVRVEGAVALLLVPAADEPGLGRSFSARLIGRGGQWADTLPTGWDLDLNGAAAQCATLPLPGHQLTLSLGAASPGVS